jgi:hypothetical protein
VLRGQITAGTLVAFIGYVAASSAPCSASPACTRRSGWRTDGFAFAPTEWSCLNAQLHLYCVEQP